MNKVELISSSKDVSKQQYIFVYTENPMVLLMHYEEENDQWLILWHPHYQKWKANQGTISMSPSLNEFVTTGTSLDNLIPEIICLKKG